MDTLGWVDYTVVTLSIVLPGLASIYYGLYNRRIKATVEQKDEKISLGLFPIYMSLTASTLSSVAMVGYPNESYLYGLDWCFYQVLSGILVSLLNIYCFMPVMLNLKMESVYEYFELRFDARLRRLASFICVVMQIAYAGVAVYPAGIIVSQFSKVSEDVATQGLAFLCTILAAIGGFTGVVWTDAYQAIVMWLCLVGFICVGYVQGGGLSRIYELARDSGRLEIFQMRLDPTLRLSFWSGVFGILAANCNGTTLNPAYYQRYSALKLRKDAIKTTIINMFQVGSIITLLSLCGLAMYSTFYGCDPKSARLVSNYMNNVAYFISKGSHSVDGFKGLFVAGVVCAALSTMSTNINMAATLVYIELIKNKKLGNFFKNETVSIQVLTMVIGALAMGFVFIIKGATSIFEVFQRFIAGVNGQSVGLFILGMFCVSANSQGSFWGGLLSLGLMSCLSFGSQMYGASYTGPSYFKPLSTDQCPFNVTMPSMSNVTASRNNIPFLFRITPYYYSLIAMLTTVIFGLSFSLLTGSSVDKAKLRCELFSPGIRRLFKKRFYREVPLEEVSPGNKNIAT